MVTGPSGAGKGTLIKALLERVPELEVAISATTRLRRQGEVLKPTRASLDRLEKSVC